MENKIQELKSFKEVSDSQLKTSKNVLKFWFSGSLSKHFHSTDIVTFKAYLDIIAPDLIQGGQYQFQIEANKQYERTSAGSKDIALGNRSEVSSLRQDFYILDVGIWSWGVNQAFIEGLAKKSAKAMLITPFCEEAKNHLKQQGSKGKDFLDRVKQAWKEDQALWHSGQDRHTWYALELAALLDLGYRLQDDQLTMIKCTESKISPEIINIGVQAYLLTEGIPRL